MSVLKRYIGGMQNSAGINRVQTLGLFVREISVLAFLLWCAVTVVFGLVRVLPGDPAELMVGEQASTADLESLREALGLNRSLLRQYIDALNGLVSGDLGVSFRTTQPVSELIAEAMPFTLGLTVVSLMVALAIALFLGVWAARNEGGWIDRLSAFVATMGLSVPNFWLGPLF
jgi:ABC-type dipeptide/oligopeptide/nickel transport system permease component